MSRAARRTRGKRAKLRMSRGMIERVCGLYVEADCAPATIAKIVGLDEQLIESILESVDRHIAEARADAS